MTTDGKKNQRAVSRKEDTHSGGSHAWILAGFECSGCRKGKSGYRTLAVAIVAIVAVVASRKSE